jgi:hypothetical protein
MRVGVMTTNGGPHPVDKWAAESAGEIMSFVKVDDDANTPEAAAVRKAKPRLELDIADALEEYHQANIDAEKEALEEHGDERLSHPFEISKDHLQEAVEAVAAAAAVHGEPFKSAFTSDNGRQIIRKALEVHYATAHDIERSWYADKCVKEGRISDHVKAFKSQGRGL